MGACISQVEKSEEAISTDGDEDVRRSAFPLE